MWSRTNRGRRSGKYMHAHAKPLEYGFTLLEVLAALVINGILLVSLLPVLTGMWRGYYEDKHRLELQYSLLDAGRTVSDAIRSAKTVERLSAGKLKVETWDHSGQLRTDYYYVDDRDYDGIKDLYRDHVVPSPVASRITRFACEEVEPGLWRISLEAEWGRLKRAWNSTVYRRSAN